MQARWKVLIAIVVSALVFLIVRSFFHAETGLINIPSIGHIVVSLPIGGGSSTWGLGVYTDSSMNTPLLLIDWGSIPIGGTSTNSLYAFNNGTRNEVLSLSTSNWSPQNGSQYLGLTWDYNNQPIASNNGITITLTMTAYSNITGITDFSVDIGIGVS
jgi:hypothetical protein